MRVADNLKSKTYEFEVRRARIRRRKDCFRRRIQRFGVLQRRREGPTNKSFSHNRISELHGVLLTFVGFRGVDLFSRRIKIGIRDAQQVPTQHSERDSDG